ncbi:MAG: flagellar hook-basal body complex protein FliE [Spongiibacteraceae bacterium]|nr:flagellar hook-basal body complex protein FliE [Spongiibacteraceae bacterium]
MKVDRPDISQLLQQMKQMQNTMRTQQEVQQSIAADSIRAPGSNGGVAQTERPAGFGELFSQAINSVNDVQQQSSALATAYEKGDPQVSLAQVMVASQKASVSFQALTQVRNRLVEAYQDVMNMPI